MFFMQFSFCKVVEWVSNLLTSQDMLQQQMAIELETEHQKRPKLRTMLAELFRFNFVLPKDYVPVMDDEVNTIALSVCRDMNR